MGSEMCIRDRATGHDGRIAVAVVVECCLASSRAVLVPGGN